jgi:hypothetical protein
MDCTYYQDRPEGLGYCKEFAVACLKEADYDCPVWNSMQVKIPEGATLSYQREKHGEWYVVWDGDFDSDDPGMVRVDPNQETLLEIGYMTALSEKSPIEVKGL